MHDQWFALIASLNGYILYSKSSHVYYRQHANNVVGAKKRSFLTRIKRLLISIRTIKNAACLTNKTVVRLYGKKENRILQKLKFVNKNVFPYFHAAKIYTVFFIYFYITNRLK